YNGLNVAEIEKQIDSKIFRKHKNSENKIIVGTIGRYNFQKAYDVLVNAVEKVIAVNTNVLFHFIGTGEEENKIKAIVTEKKLDKNIIYTGYTSEIFKYLAGFDIFVLTSRYEGIPYVLLEAMYLEIPIVCTRVGGIDNILKNYENAIITEPDSPDETSKAILKLISDDDLRNNIFIKIWNYFDKKVLANATSIIVLSDAMKIVVERKMKAYSVYSEKKVVVIHNWADGNFIKPLDKSENNFLKQNDFCEKFIVQYSGNIGASYDLEVIIETANLAKNENDIIFLFIGDGVKKNKLEKMSQNYNLSNVLFLPYQHKSELPNSLTAPSISIVTYESYLEGLLMPSKLYTTLAAGIPVVGLCSDDSEVARIINKARCGFIIDNNDADKLFKDIISLRSDIQLQNEYGNNARAYFDSNFTLDIAVQKYYNVINSKL
ncbi:unnamed protein product, partial [Rotaria sp. Silwood1]